MGKAVFCIADSRPQAQKIVVALRLDGFQESDVSVLFPDKFGERDLGYERATKAPEGATAGLAIGGVVGGTVGWLAGTGAMALPGLSTLIAAGPVLAALAGIGVGGVAGATAGGIVGLGIPEFEAKQYVSKIRGGNILIAVHTEEEDEDGRRRALAILAQYEAHDIVCGPEELV